MSTLYPYSESSSSVIPLTTPSTGDKILSSSKLKSSLSGFLKTKRKKSALIKAIAAKMSKSIILKKRNRTNAVTT